MSVYRPASRRGELRSAERAYSAYANLDNTVNRAVSAQATPFGCCNFFDRCTDELMSLHFSGSLPLLDWMGFEVSDECYQSMEFITYVRPTYVDGSPTEGYLDDACTEPNGYDIGTAKISVEDFGRFGRKGPTRDFMKPKNYCKTDPVRRLDGVIVTDEREWDIRFATDMIIGDISKYLIIGNSTTTGQFDGLERWVRTGYAGPNGQALDSWVVNWNGNPMSGGAGITINGNAIATTFNIVDVLEALVAKIKQRIGWARQLKNQQMMLGDMILLAPTSIAECLVNYFACWSVCGGSQYNEVQKNSIEVRDYRSRLLAEGAPNLFGAGYITLRNMVIPIMSYDFELIKGPKTGDIYLLTGGIGSVDVWQGQHISAEMAAQKYAYNGYFSIDGGRMLGVMDTTNECETLKMWMHPRLFCRAPWAQIRIQSVQCDSPGGLLSADPTETSFYIQTSFTNSEC